jgi:hypothetical protein
MDYEHKIWNLDIRSLYRVDYLIIIIIIIMLLLLCAAIYRSLYVVSVHYVPMYICTVLCL